MHHADDLARMRAETDQKTSISFRKLQHEAKERSMHFLEMADTASSAKEAADWTWAAKHSVSVAVSCETILKIQNGGR